MRRDVLATLSEAALEYFADRRAWSPLLAVADSVPDSSSPALPSDLLLFVLLCGVAVGFLLGTVVCLVCSGPVKRLFIGALCYSLELEPARNARTLRVYRG